MPFSTDVFMGQSFEYWLELREQMEAKHSDKERRMLEDVLVQLNKSKAKVAYYEEMIERMQRFSEINRELRMTHENDGKTV